MKRMRVIAIWVAIYLSIVSLGFLAYWQSQRPLEFYYDGNSYTHRRFAADPFRFAADPLTFASLEELHDAKLDPNPDARFLFTLADHLNCEQLGLVLNDYARSGLGSSMQWRIKGGLPTRYDFPPYAQDDPRNSVNSGAENPSLVKIPGSTACLLAISLREDDILLNDVPVTLEELSAVIQKITQGVEIGLRYMELRLPEEASLNSAKGLFDWIANHKWDYLLWIDAPLDPTNYPMGEGGFVTGNGMWRRSERYRYGFRPPLPPNPHFPESIPDAESKVFLPDLK